MHFSHLGTSLKTLSWQKSGPCIHNHSLTAIFTPPIPWNLSTAKCCSSGPNCTAAFFVWSVKWCTCLMACQQPVSIVTEFQILVPRWGKCISMFGEYNKKWWNFLWNKWPTLEAVVTSHWCSGTMKPYLLYNPCRFQQQLPAEFQKLLAHKKQYKIPNKKFTF